MFELKILLINVVLPSVITVLTILLVRKMSVSALDHTVIVACGAVVAIWLAVALRTEFSFWHEDAWMRMPVGMIGVALAAILTTELRSIIAVWLVRASATLVAAYLIFPTGEVWKDLLPSQNMWIFFCVVSTLVGWFLIEQQPPRRAAVLGLSWIALFAAAAFLTSQSFLKVTEPLLAVSSVVGCLSLASLTASSTKLVAASAGPVLFALSAEVSSAQFNSYLELPNSLSWLAMSSPALAALLTQIAARKTDSTAVTKSFCLVAICGSLLLATLLVVWTQFALPVGGEEW